MAGNLIKKVSPDAEKPIDSALEAGRKPFIGEKLTRNIAICTLALLCVVSAKDIYIGNGTVLQAVQNAVRSEWDQNVGKLTYVGSFLSDSVQVFASADIGISLTVPAYAAVKQAFTQAAPYIVYEGAEAVFASADGEVMHLAHADDDTYIVRIRHNDSIETLYYGLNVCLVEEGDSVSASTRIGAVQPGGELAFEVRRDGLPIDGTPRLAAR